ncbi:MAG: hypothetical protein HY819_06830 [Acidobacteria bacterium]|nr:hypothetical protein [Acidobacteriota bacterium]
MLKKNNLPLVLSLSLLLTPNFTTLSVAQNNPSTNNQIANVEAINPRDYNVLIISDERLLVTMSALTLAGYKYEGTGKLAELQANLREDLKGTSPDLIKKLQNFYSSHKLEGREEAAQISPYIGLALSLSAPPALNNPSVKANLPLDVQDVLDFGSLLREFYSRSQVRNFLPKYKALLDGLRNDYENIASSVLYETLIYLRTKPVLELPPTPVFSRELDTYVMPPPVEVKKDKKDKKATTEEKPKEKIEYVPRIRRLQIFPNPFAPAGTVLSRNDVLNGADSESRRLGDDYFIVMSEQSTREHIRHAFLRFVLDPIVGKNSVEIAELKERIDPLIAVLPNAKERAKRNVFEVVGESIARAVGIRLTARLAGGNVGSDEAISQLSQYYEQGFVLVFHFYDALAGLERSGVDVGDFFPAMLTSIDFAHEAKRLDETKASRARFQEQLKERKAAVKATITAVKPIIDIDTLIKQRKFDEAKSQLEVILREQPKNARALFGMAQIINNQPSRVELDDINSDDDKIAAQEERLSSAVKLYREAISSASAEEKWLVSQCHVLIGRIYDFIEERDAAIREYDKAVQLGDIPQGAYKEAQEGKTKPFAPK